MNRDVDPLARGMVVGQHGAGCEENADGLVVSVREEESGAHLYRGGAAPDRSTVLEQIVRAGREIAHREDGSVIALAGEVVIDGTPVDAIAFGDPGVNDETLRFEIGAAFDRVRSHTGVRPEMRRSSTGSVPGMRAQQG